MRLTHCKLFWRRAHACMRASGASAGSSAGRRRPHVLWWQRQDLRAPNPWDRITRGFFGTLVVCPPLSERQGGAFIPYRVAARDDLTTDESTSKARIT